MLVTYDLSACNSPGFHVMSVRCAERLAILPNPGHNTAKGGQCCHTAHPGTHRTWHPVSVVRDTNRSITTCRHLPQCDSLCVCRPVQCNPISHLPPMI